MLDTPIIKSFMSKYYLIMKLLYTSTVYRWSICNFIVA